MYEFYVKNTGEYAPSNLFRFAQFMAKTQAHQWSDWESYEDGFFVKYTPESDSDIKLVENCTTVNEAGYRVL